MKIMFQILFPFVFVLSISSMAFSDPTSAIASLVGRNAEGYLSPVGTILGTDMNSGFYRKASPHKILGFDLTIDVVYAMAPVGKTTYQFVIPNDSISFPFQFQFPKSLLSSDLAILDAIPTAAGSLDETLYQDQTITFGLALSDMLDTPPGLSQNMFGNDSSTTLIVRLDNAIPQIFSQVVDNTWQIAKNIPGLGTEYEVKEPTTGVTLTTLQPLYANSDSFTVKYGDPLDALIRSGLGEMTMPELPIPGGFGNDFDKLPIPAGIPMPILQASVGLPFHTEITVRGLPVEVPLPSLGTIKFGGFGGKIGISEYLSDFLYPSDDISLSSETENMNYIINTPPANLNPMDIEKAITDLQLRNIDVQEIDSLNYLFVQGDTTIAIQIQNRFRDSQLQLEAMPKPKKKKKKKFPIDLALGYYTNDIKLDMDGPKINSTNSMISLQAGKTFNFPFIAFLGGIGLYGGIGFESSTLDLGYTLANPLAYGCFKDATNDNYNSTYTTEEECIIANDEWHAGVPTAISLSFPGENKFRKLIGARIRILFVDAYVDYNMGTSNAYNAGIGITFR